MTLKELGSCTHLRREDKVIVFKKHEKIFYALCPQCKGYLRWDNWTKLHEPLRAKCAACGIVLSSTELNLEPLEGSIQQKNNQEKTNQLEKKKS